MSRAFSASSRLLGATQKIPLPYGAWPSPLSTDLVLASAIALGDNYVGPKALVWTEQRPEQGGRNALVSRIDGKVQEVLQDEKWNARTRVHVSSSLGFERGVELKQRCRSMAERALRWLGRASCSALSRAHCTRSIMRTAPGVLLCRSRLVRTPSQLSKPP